MSVGTDPDPIEEGQEEIRGQMSFLDHLEELRRRILNSLVAVGVSFGICWYFSDKLFAIIAKPIISVIGELNFMTPTEPFNLLVKISLVAACFLSAPFLMAQIWLFIAPGLYKRERRYALPFIISSSVLFITGGLFGYFVAFPFAVQFLVGIGQGLQMKAVINASDYFDLMLTVELALGIIFEIPAVIFVLARIGLVSGGFLLRNMKYAVLLSAIVAAIITPTSDIPNMLIIMVPMLMLYMLGIIVAYIFGKKRKTDD